MKVKCINDGKHRYLTINKMYDLIGESEKSYYIVDYDWYDFEENEHDCPKEWFKTLSEIRNEKIDKLLENES